MTTTFGKYEVEAELGSGAFATVYRARDMILDRTVALKVLKPALMADQISFARFVREAQVTANLFHPHIATVLDMGEANGRHFIAMRYVDGLSLDKVLAQHGPLPWAEALKITEEIAAALDFAHGRGLVHRDVKPQNIILGKEEGAVLTDFGLVKAIQSTNLTTSSGIILGSQAYLAPEIWNGRPATTASDIYSLACVFYEMLIGQPLFAAETPQAMLAKHTIDPIEMPTVWPIGVSPRVETVLRKALARNPVERYARGVDMIKALPRTTSTMIVSSVGKAPTLQSPQEAGTVSAVHLAVPYKWRSQGEVRSLRSLAWLALSHWSEALDQFEKGEWDLWLLDGQGATELVQEAQRLRNWYPTDIGLALFLSRIVELDDLPTDQQQSLIERLTAAGEKALRELHLNAAAEIGEILEQLEPDNDMVTTLKNACALPLIPETVIRMDTSAGWTLPHGDDIAFSPTGELLISWAKNTAWLWNVLEHRVLRMIEMPSHIEQMGFSPDGLMLYGLSEKGAEVWRLNDGMSLDVMETNLKLDMAAFSPNGDLLVRGWLKNSIGAEVWRVSDKQKVTGAVLGCVFSPDGSMLASVERGIQIQRSSDGSRICQIDASSRQWDKIDRSVTFSLDGSILAVLNGGSQLMVQSVPSTSVVITRIEQENYHSLCIAPNGTLLAARRYDSVDLYDLSSGKLCLQFTARGSSQLLAFSPDSTMLAYSNDGADIVICWIAMNSLIRTLRFNDQLKRLVFSPDGTLLATVADKVQLWGVFGNRTEWESMRTRLSDLDDKRRYEEVQRQQRLVNKQCLICGKLLSPGDRVQDNTQCSTHK